MPTPRTVTETLKLKKLETESKVSHTDSYSHFGVTKFIPLVPDFHENDVDQYFLHLKKSLTV